VPERPEAFWERTHDALSAPPVVEWETWPFDGPVAPRPLAPPVRAEVARRGAGGIDCHRCIHGDEGALWYEFHDLPDDLAAELGPLLVRIQRAVYAVGDIGNVHVCRWGDGSEHFHYWFMARPARIPQLSGSFAAIWDDVLPPLPEDVWRGNLELVRRELAAA
jgi:hypothetical protein